MEVSVAHSMNARHSAGSVLCQYHGFPAGPEPVLQVCGQPGGNGLWVTGVIVPGVVAVDGYHIHKLRLYTA